MKLFRHIINKGIYRRTVTTACAAICMLVTLQSCDNSFIYEDLPECERHYYVSYVFNMNMSYADAFAAKVNSVTLLIFNPETGELVSTYTDSGDALKATGYRMEVELEPGEYELIAWCGLENNNSLFTLPEEMSHRSHAHCRMDRDYDNDGRAVQNKWLPHLFHGKITAEFPDLDGDHEVTVPLVKDTNNINISLQHVSGLPLTSDMFTVTLTEGNGHMAFDNSLIEEEDIDFYPWHVADGNVDLAGTRGEEEPTLNYFKAELSTPRLMADRNPRINITDNATGNTVYSIPIIQWALEFRSAQHASMPDQEYLDREDEYNVMLYLDNKEDGGWIAASIFINGWRVVKHDGTGI